MRGTFAKLKARANISNSRKQLLSTSSGLFLLGLVFSLLSPYFFTVNNLLTMATQTAVIAIIAIGQTYVLITGGIDLAIGSNMALAGMLAALCMRSNFPVPVAILVGLITGVVSGAASGTLIACAKIPPFIATLGLMTICRGITLTITGAIPISNLPKSFTAWGTDSTLGIPNAVISMVVLTVVFGFILAKTKLGRHIYATGSNYEAARLSGVDTKRTLVIAYIFSGILAATAGLIMAARIISAQPTAGDGYELDAVASSVIGGTSTIGGEGSIAGTFIGAFVIGILRNGLNLVGVSPFIQKIVIGVVIVVSVFLDKVQRKGD
jgi:ribose transport system permease protein